VLREQLLRLPFAVRHAIADREGARELRATEGLYQAMLRASPDVVAITDLDGRVLRVSSAAVSIFGYESEAQITGRQVTEFVAPEDRGRAEDRTARMLSGELPGPDEYRGLRADGSGIDIEANGHAVRDAQGQPEGLIFVLRDITARKRAESLLRESEANHRIIADNTYDWEW
jgi:PAS domain S-box-containing protein